MLQFGVSATVPLRSLLLFGSLILLPTLARADDMSFSGGSGCGDPPISSEIFTLPATNAGGGMCKAFGNHSTKDFQSLQFSTQMPADTDRLLCDGGNYFVHCGFSVDGSPVLLPNDSPHPTFGTTLTVEFFGIDGTHPGIPIDPVSVDPRTGKPDENFFINLNNPNADGRQPNNDTSPGDWFNTIQGAANPEPGTWMLLLGGIGALLARARLGRNDSGR